MQVSALLLMVSGVLISSVSQILLKKGAIVNEGRTGFAAQYLNRYVIGGYLLLLIAMLIPFYVYQLVELKYGAVMEPLGYVFVMILSYLAFGEKITPRRLIGNALIILGVVLFNLKLV